MYEQDWQALGIEPTSELLVIKRAYAARLRVTRPDDDAEAYQRLREAYERAQAWVRHALAAEPPAPPAAVATADVIEPVAQPKDDDVVVEWVDSEQLQQWTERLGPGTRRDEEQLLAAWREIQPRLGSVPLHLQVEAAARFADLVIREPRLPLAIVEALDAHFRWLEDFRVGRQLGMQRIEALREVLDIRIARPIRDAGVLTHFAPLLHLRRLLDQGRKFTAFWFALRVGEGLRRLAAQLDERLRNGLGLGEESSPPLGALLARAQMARLAVAGAMPLLLAAVAMLMHDQFSFIMVGVGIFYLFVATRVFVGAAVVLRVASISGLGLNKALGERWFRLRMHRRCEAWGLGLTALGAVLTVAVQHEADALLLPALLVWGVGLLLAWPRSDGGSIVALAAIVTSLVITERVFGVAQPLWSPLWVLAGCYLYALGEHVPVLSVLVRPVTNNLALCDRHGHLMALLPPTLAVVAALGWPSLGGGYLLVIWSLANLAVNHVLIDLSEQALQEVG